MAVLLIAEITDGALSMDATAKTVAAAKALGDVVVLAAGATAKAAADEAATIDGVSKVLLAEDDDADAIARIERVGLVGDDGHARRGAPCTRRIGLARGRQRRRGRQGEVRRR